MLIKLIRFLFRLLDRVEDALTSEEKKKFEEWKKKVGK